MHEKRRYVKLEKYDPAMGLRCVVTGHRWTDDKNAHGPFPVLRCRRCGRARELTPGTQTFASIAEREGRRGAEMGGLAPTRFRR
jgi:hypothetical protein